jgi:hypothetical protein
LAVRLWLGLAALALAGCQAPAGAEGEAPGIGARLGAGAVGAFSLGRRVAQGVGSESDLALPRPSPGGFGAADIAADLDLYRFVQVNALGLAEPARVVSGEGETFTLELQSGRTAAFRDGVLVATRGFGEDLQAMEAPGLLGLLAAGGGTLQRRMEVVDGQDRVTAEALACTVTAAGPEVVDLGTREVEAQRLDESCRGSRVIFDNIWYLDAAGAIVASRQYVSPSVAYLRSNRL